MPQTLGIIVAYLGAALGGAAVVIEGSAWFWAIVEVASVAYAYIKYQSLKKRRPDAARAGNGYLANTQTSEAAIPVAYGRHRVGGNRVYVNSTGSSNKFIHMIIVLSEGPIESVENVYLNDKDISTFGALASYEFYNGSGTQVHGAPDGKWVDNLRFTAYLYVKLEYNKDKFTSGVPKVTALIKGRQIYDTRSGNTAYSDNPALVWRDWMTNSRYGLGLPSSMIDDASVSDAANWAETQTNPYTFNGIIMDRQAFTENLGDILRNFRAETIWGEGKYKLLVRKDETPVMDLTEDDIVADSFSFNIPGIAETPNRVIVTYPAEMGPGLVGGTAADWTTDAATVTEVGGRLRVTNTGANGEIYQGFTTVIGQKYNMRIELFSGTSDASWYISDAAPNSYTGGHGWEASVTGVRTQEFTALANTTYIRLENASAVVGEYSEYANISIQKTTDSPDLGWIEVEQVIEDSAAVLTFDNEERDFGLDLIGTTNPIQANLLGIYNLERARLNKTFSFAAHPRTLALEPGDVIQVVHTTPGWSAPELIVNGSFSADTDWIKGTGWTIPVGKATCDGTQIADSLLTQDITATNVTYEVKYAVSGLTAGTVKARVGGADGVTRTSNGSYVERITSSASDTLFSIVADLNFVGSIDDVSVQTTVGTVRIVSAALGADGLSALTVQEESPLLYDDTLNLSPRTFHSTSLPDVLATVGDVTGVSFIEEEYFNKDVSYTRLKVSFAPPDSPFWSHSEVWVDLAGAGYNHYTDVTGPFVIEPVKEGVLYSVKLASVSVQGVTQVVSSAATWTHNVIGKNTPPADPTGFKLVPQSDTIALMWSASNNVDLAGYEVRRGTNWNGGLFMGFTKAVSMRFTGVPPGTHTYMLKTLDTNGNYSVGYLLSTTTVYGPASYTERLSELNDFSNKATYTTTAKVLGDRVVPTTLNGYYYECTQAGTPSAEPVWPTVNGTTIADGGVIWTCYADHAFTGTERWFDSTVSDWVLRVDRAYGGGSNLTGSYLSPVYDRDSTVTRRSWLQYDTTFNGTGTIWTDQFLPSDLWTDVFGAPDTWISLFGPFIAGSLTMKLWYSSNGTSWLSVDSLESLAMETQGRYVKYEIFLTDVDVAGYIEVLGTATFKEAYW